MSGLNFSAQTTQFTTGTTKKTVLQLKAASNHRFLVKEISISFKGVVNTDSPILVEVARQSDEGQTGAGDVITLKKLDPGADETVQTTALENLDGSVQPTEGDVLMREEVHPQGAFTWQAPFGKEIVVAGNGRIGIAVTAAVSVNCVGRMIGEE